MSETGATLVAHVDTNVVTREQLALIPVPAETDTFKPQPHVTLIEMVQACLEHKGISIVKEQFAVRSDGSKLFATFDLSLAGISEATCGSLGLRTGIDRSMRTQMITGMRVFVCDNMAFSGDEIILNRKHTKGWGDPLPQILEAIGRFQVRYATLLTEITSLASMILADGDAKALIHDAFMAEVMPIRFMPNVSEAYFKPTIPDWEPRTAWSLHNAFTGIMKEMNLNRRMEATQGLGRVFGLLGEGPDVASGEAITLV